MLYKERVKSFIGKGSERLACSGQILGCNYTAVKEIQPAVQASVYFGDGYFHALGLVFSTKKPVIVVNPIQEKVEEIAEKERDRFLRKRFAAIARASQCKSFGIIVSVKSGQRQKEKALELKKAIDPISHGGRTPLGQYMKIGADALLAKKEKQHNYGSYRLLVVTDGEASDQRAVDKLNNAIKLKPAYPDPAKSGSHL